MSTGSQHQYFNIKGHNIEFLWHLFRQELGVSNLVEDIVGKRPTVIGWGYTFGFDPYNLSVQGDLRDYGVGSKSLQKLDVTLPFFSLWWIVNTHVLGSCTWPRGVLRKVCRLQAYSNPSLCRWAFLHSYRDLMAMWFLRFQVENLARARAQEMLVRAFIFRWTFETLCHRRKVDTMSQNNYFHMSEPTWSHPKALVVYIRNSYQPCHYYQ